MTATCFTVAPIDHAAIKAAWDEVTARWPIPPHHGHARQTWMAKHRSHLNEAYKRHHHSAQAGQFDLFAAIAEAT